MSNSQATPARPDDFPAISVSSPETGRWLAAIVESSDDAIISKTLNGIISSWNAAAQRIFGYTPEEAIGKPVLMLIPEDRYSEETEILGKIRRGERVDHYETVRKRKDGSFVEVSLTVSPIKDANGHILGASKIARDISDRKLSQERIRRLNDTLASMLQSMPDILYVIDRGQIRYKNPAAESFSKALNIHNNLPPHIQEHVEEVMRTGKSHLPTDFKDVLRYRVGNDEKKFLLRIVAMGHSPNQVFGAAVMLQDVTQFSLLDEVKSNLLATVSHEIKTPVTSMRLALMLLLEKAAGELKPNQEELLKMAHADCERLLNTLHRLLDLTRYEQSLPEMTLETLSPSLLMQAAVDDVLPTAIKKGINIKLEVEENLPEIRIDRGRMTHVVTNLLNNAIKYSDPGSEIVACACKGEPDRIRISVVDSGPGIPKEYHDKIFDRFFRIPENTKPGAGLGLFIVRLFTQAHGGSVGLRSSPGDGSEFFVSLPIDQAVATKS